MVKVDPSTKKQQEHKGPFRSPKRFTITIPYSVYEQLLMQSDDEGRSLSSLVAFRLEQAISQSGEHPMSYRDGHSQGAGERGQLG
jgi:hypothetical protein